MPAGLPLGSPGIGLEMEGAMQHAAQPGRQSMSTELRQEQQQLGRELCQQPQQPQQSAGAPLTFGGFGTGNGQAYGGNGTFPSFQMPAFGGFGPSSVDHSLRMPSFY
jgi:hypothetical protein